MGVLENPAEIVRVRIPYDLADFLDIEVRASDHQASGFGHAKVNQVLDRRYTGLPLEDPNEIGAVVWSSFGRPRSVPAAR
jgi:hypothetical protein